jgi:hypothetical protein
MRNIYRTLVRKPAEKVPYQRPTNRRENNVKMLLNDIVCEKVYWIHAAQDGD